MNPLCHLADLQGAPAETLLPRQQLVDRKRHTSAEQQHPVGEGDGPRRAQHSAALSGSHGRDVFHRFLPAEVQEQRVLSWKGKEL